MKPCRTAEHNLYSNQRTQVLHTNGTQAPLRQGGVRPLACRQLLGQTVHYSTMSRWLIFPMLWKFCPEGWTFLHSSRSHYPALPALCHYMCFQRCRRPQTQKGKAASLKIYTQDTSICGASGLCAFGEAEPMACSDLPHPCAGLTLVLSIASQPVDEVLWLPGNYPSITHSSCTVQGAWGGRVSASRLRPWSHRADTPGAVGKHTRWCWVLRMKVEWMKRGTPHLYQRTFWNRPPAPSLSLAHYTVFLALSEHSPGGVWLLWPSVPLPSGVTTPWEQE